MTLLLALDLGTTGQRSVLFDGEGNMLGYAYEEWESFHPAPALVEQDANAWWNATKQTIKDVLGKTGVDPSEITAVAVTNQRETIVPVDRRGEPLARAIVWQDRRTGAQCKEIQEIVGKEEVYEKTGLTIDPYFSASKILWFKEERPSIYEKASKFLLVHDFMVHKLTGEFITEPSNASRTMLFDINTRAWSSSIIDSLGIDMDKLPRVVDNGTVVGTCDPESGAGLSPETVVVAGAGDQQCAALGVGVTRLGRSKCTMGTGTFLLAYSDKVLLDDEKRVLCSCGAIPGTYVSEASMFSTGSLLRWARDTIGAAETAIARERGVSPYQVIDELAAESPPGANGLLFLPFIVGAGAPYWNPDARGTLFGLAAGHQRGDIYRSILESTSFDVKKNLDAFSRLGISVEELRLTGGGSRSRVWTSILADVAGVPCLLPRYEESTAVGAAILAAKGAGLFGTIEEAAEVFARLAGEVIPEPSKTTAYERVIALYEKLYDCLDSNGLFKQLRQIST